MSAATHHPGNDLGRPGRFPTLGSDESSSSDAWRSEQSPCPAEGWSVIRRPWAQASLPSCEAMSFVAVSSLTVDGCRQHIPHAILEGRCGAQAWKGGTGDPPSSSLGRSMAGVVALRGSRRFKAHRPVGFRPPGHGYLAVNRFSTHDVY